MAAWKMKEATDTWEDVCERAIAWGKLVGESIRLGKTRPSIDAQLAATALVNGMVLVARNEKDFEHSGVQVLNPFAKRP